MKGGRWMLWPLYLWTILLVALPMGYVLAISFLTRGEVTGATLPFTLENYRRLFDPVNLNIFAASMKLGALTSLGTLLIGYPFAYAMAGRPPRQRALILLLVVVPFWTSALLRTYGWMTFLRSGGLLNNLLMALGLTEKPVKFLYNEGAVLFGMVYTFLPFMILPIYTSLEKLDGSVVEAARDLGANRFMTFATVTLPLTLPGMVSGCVMTFVPSVALFFISDLMGGSTSMLLGNLINHYLHAGRNWPLGAALSMVMVGLTFVTMGIYRRVVGGGELGVF